MKNKSGYQITEKDIESTLKYLRLNEDENATREDAIQYLEEHKSLAHLAAHKIVEDEKTGKNEPVDLDKLDKKD
jgi:hypothetical protein